MNFNIYSRYFFRNHCKYCTDVHVGPRTAKSALSFALEMKMVEYI